MTCLLYKPWNKIEKLVYLYRESKIALQIVANPTFYERTKHIEINYHFVRKKIKEGLIMTDYISTNQQLADLMNKGLGTTQHELLLSKLECLVLFKCLSPSNGGVL